MDASDSTVPGLAEAIEKRRREKGLTLKEFASVAGVTPQGLVPLRKGYRRNYRERLKIGVCTALGWTADSIDRLIEGLPPVPATDYSRAPAELGSAAPITRKDLDAVRRELKLDLDELRDALFVDLDQVDVDASPADGGTLSFKLGAARPLEVGDRAVLVLTGSRAQFQELLRKMAGYESGGDSE